MKGSQYHEEAWIYRYVRQARLVAGADEVHKMVLDRAFRADGMDLWQWGC